VDTLTLTIKDSTGALFRTLPALPTTAGSHTVEWDGRNDQGKLATRHGDYVVEFSAAADKNGALLEATRTSSIGVLGDYRVDAQGKRLNKRLKITDVTDATQRLLGIKAQEIGP
jgi:flagellar basal-body rod modification protein FlgD